MPRGAENVPGTRSARLKSILLPRPEWRRAGVNRVNFTLSKIGAARLADPVAGLRATFVFPGWRVGPLPAWLSVLPFVEGIGQAHGSRLLLATLLSDPVESV